MKKRWVILGAFATVGISGGAYFLHHGHIRAQPPIENINASLAITRRGTISDVIPASGSMSSNGDVVIYCRASGEVTKLPFSVGDSVKKGDLVCQLDPSIEQNAVDQAKMAISRATRKLEETRQSATQAEADLQISVQQAEESIASLRVKATNLQNKADRQKKLLSQSLASQEEFESAQTDAAQAGTEFRNAILTKQELKNRGDMLQTDKAMDIEAVEDLVKSDEITLKNAEDRLNSTTIKSPMDGVISDLKVSLNTWIATSGSEYGRQPVMTISDLSRIFTNVSIDEQKIGSVHAGQKAEIKVDAYPGHNFSGVVARVSPTGIGSAEAVMFGVKIEVTSPDKGLLKPPMTANVRIIGETRDGVLLVPARAVERKEQNPYVTILGADGRHQDRPVRLGLTDGADAEILEGLSAGDRVLVQTRKTAAIEVAQNGEW